MARTSICYISGCFSRYDVLIFHRQGQSLAAAGFDVTYILCDDMPDERKNGINIVSCGWKPKSRAERMKKSRKFLYREALRADADIYQVSEPELISIGLKLKRRGKKVVFNMRENYPALIMDKRYIPRFLRKAVSVMLSGYIKRSLRKYDAVISITPDLDRTFKEEWGIGNSYVIANYPVVGKGTEIASIGDYMDRGNVMLYIGTVYSISCQHNVFKALSELPSVSYLIAGVVEEGYLGELKQDPYWSKVEFINGFDKSEMPGIFSRATMSNVLRDFTKTGLPNGSLGIIKMFESMEAGLPVICSDVKINREIIAKYNCGICVDPNSVKDIEQAVRYLVMNREEAYEMGRNGRRAVIEEYNWESQAEKYIDIFKAL